VIGSGLLLSQTLRFPGWVAAIPVLGTVAVIAAGTPSGDSGVGPAGSGRFGLSGLIRSRPVQFTGGISYSLYLWHWPVIILFGRGPGGIEDSGTSRFVLLAVSVLLAVASTYLIEAPVRRMAANRRHRSALTLGFAAAGMAVVPAVALVGQARVHSAQAVAEQQITAIRQHPPECFGAAALDPRKPNCAAGTAAESARAGRAELKAAEPERQADQILVPSPVSAFDDKPKTCMQAIDKAALRVCTTGPAAAKATRQVAVIGDSHAMAWMPALQAVALQRDWRLYALLKGSCPLIEAVRVMGAQDASSCVKWNDAVQAWMDQHPEIDQVIVTASSKNEFVPRPRLSWQQTAVQGYLKAWDELPDSVHRIVVLRDVPRPREDVVACAQAAVSAERAVRECGRAADRALLNDPEVQAAQQSDRKPTLINLSRYFCVDGYCSPEIGGAFVYRDGHHMTATFARTLAPYVGKLMP
jgi:hypothetical protein